MSDSSNKKILSGIGWAYGERILAQVISLIVSIILARLLDPEHYGIIAIVTVFINILDALVSGGFGNALVQKKDADDLDFNTICWFSIGLSLVLYLALFLGSPAIASFYEMPELLWVTRVMGIRIIISAFNSIQHAYVQRHMEFKRFFFATLGGTLISAVVGIAMAYRGYGVWALVGQYMTNSCIDTIVLRMTIKWKPKLQWSYERLKSRLCHNKQLINSHFYRGVSELPYKLLFAVIYTHLEFRYEVSHTITSHHVHHFHQTRIPDGTLLDYMVQYRKPLFPQFFLYPKKFLPENNPHHKEFHLRPYIQNNANQ